jgi:hypothetical protein
MTKDEIQAAIIFINDKFDQDYIETEEYYHIFKYHGDTIRAALQSQLTKNDENVTCGNLSNADGRQDKWSAFYKYVESETDDGEMLIDGWVAAEDVETIRAALQSPRVPVIKILETVLEQAEDDGLWFNAKYASEAYLQQELRRLHTVIERAYSELQKGN